jgi:lysine 2,3-aminomutase
MTGRLLDGERGSAVTFPTKVTRFYQGLVQVADPAKDPIAAQFLPQKQEEITLAYESTDPLQDRAFEVSPRLIHRYRDRALLITTDTCAVNCRHCFRRHVMATESEISGSITEGALSAATRYITQHTEIREVILSGGDPLTLSPEKVERLIRTISAIRESLVLRVSTRIPVVAPRMINDRIVGALLAGAPLWLVIQVNHPREITEEFRSVIAAVVDSGIPVVSQTVLLKGVNASAGVLGSLFSGLVGCRVKPYYLFQGDLAAGTSHFRTSIETGLRLMDQLRGALSGLAMPTYAVDLPQGGGKTVLTRGAVLRIDDGWYVIESADGSEHRYPVEE